VLQDGTVHSVVMCTAASNATGWVSFLKEVLEKWFGKAVYDHVIDGDMIRDWHHGMKSTCVREDGTFVKDMNQIRHVTGVDISSEVYIIDDRHMNVVNGRAIPIAPYNVAVNLVEVARQFVPEWTASFEREYSRVFQESWRRYRLSPGMFSDHFEDDAIFNSKRMLELYLDLDPR
jgi:glycogen debranching enzyme